MPERWSGIQRAQLDSDDVKGSLAVAEQVTLGLGGPEAGKCRRRLRETVGALEAGGRRVLVDRCSSEFEGRGCAPPRIDCCGTACDWLLVTREQLDHLETAALSGPALRSPGRHVAVPVGTTNPRQAFALARHVGARVLGRSTQSVRSRRRAPGALVKEAIAKDAPLHELVLSRKVPWISGVT